MREGQIEKRLALRHSLLQAAAGRGVECFALDLEHRFLMRRIEHELMPIVSAIMPGDLE